MRGMAGRLRGHAPAAARVPGQLFGSSAAGGRAAIRRHEACQISLSLHLTYSPRPPGTCPHSHPHPHSYLMLQVRIMDSTDLERERGITILSKVRCSWGK